MTLKNKKIQTLLESCIEDAQKEKAKITNLMPMAKTPFDSNLLRTIQLNITKHIHMFDHIYFNLTDAHFSFEPSYPQILGDLNSNLKDSFHKSFDNITTYRYIYFLFDLGKEKDMLFEIFTDEQLTISKLSYLLNS